MKFLLRNWCHSKEKSRTVERRAEPRHEMHVVCPASFVVDKKEGRALLLDLSPAGAKFGTAVSNRDMGIAPGQVLNFTVNSPFGAGTCIGKVVWTRPDGRVYTWGVRFSTSLAAEPFQQLMGGVVAS